MDISFKKHIIVIIVLTSKSIVLPSKHACLWYIF